MEEENLPRKKKHLLRAFRGRAESKTPVSCQVKNDQKQRPWCKGKQTKRKPEKKNAKGYARRPG
jgi:hypothetical protein